MMVAVCYRNVGKQVPIRLVFLQIFEILVHVVTCNLILCVSMIRIHGLNADSDHIFILDKCIGTTKNHRYTKISMSNEST